MVVSAESKTAVLAVKDRDLEIRYELIWLHDNWPTTMNVDYMRFHGIWPTPTDSLFGQSFELLETFKPNIGYFWTIKMRIQPMNSWVMGLSRHVMYSNRNGSLNDCEWAEWLKRNRGISRYPIFHYGSWKSSSNFSNGKTWRPWNSCDTCFMYIDNVWSHGYSIKSSNP